MMAITQSIANDCFVVCLFLFICVLIYFFIYLSVCVFVFNIASENLVKELRKLLQLDSSLYSPHLYTAMVYQHSKLRTQHNWEKRYENIPCFAPEWQRPQLRLYFAKKVSLAPPPPSPPFVYIEFVRNQSWCERAWKESIELGINCFCMYPFSFFKNTISLSLHFKQHELTFITICS